MYLVRTEVFHEYKVCVLHFFLCKMCWIWRHLNVNAAWNLFHNGKFIQIISPMTFTNYLFQRLVYTWKETQCLEIPPRYPIALIGQISLVIKSNSLFREKNCITKYVETHILQQNIYFEKILLRTNQIWSKQWCNYWAQEHVCNRIQDTEIRLKETSAKTL